MICTTKKQMIRVQQAHMEQGKIKTIEDLYDRW